MKRNLIPWIVILLIAIGLPVLQVYGRSRAGNAATTMPSNARIDFQTTIAGKSIVGGALAAPREKASLGAQLAALERTPMQRIAAATLAGELEGPEAARGRLATLVGNDDAAAFATTYATGAPLPTAVAGRYEFFADLAESNGKPESDPQRARVVASARRTLVVLGAASVVIVAAILLGLGLFVTATILLALGKIGPDVAAPSPANSSAYVQSFAIYLATIVLASIAVEVASRTAPAAVPDEAKYAPLLLAVALGFAWPIVRGVPWATMREDWGLHRGRGLLIEPLAGIAGYLAGLPIVVIGFVLASVLAKLSGSTMSHPIANELSTQPILIFFIAAVLAPLTEEALFRGALLSHLREAWGPWVAALISGIIFAAIHPQGWAALPALGSIGFVFAMIRQWRRSLIASITAHAVNNGAIVGMLLLATR